MVLEPPLLKAGSQNFDTMRPMNGYEKSPSFMALAQTVFGTDRKNHSGAIRPPLTINRVKSPETVLKFKRMVLINSWHDLPKTLVIWYCDQ